MKFDNPIETGKSEIINQKSKRAGKPKSDLRLHLEKLAADLDPYNRKTGEGQYSTVNCSNLSEVNRVVSTVSVINKELKGFRLSCRKKPLTTSEDGAVDVAIFKKSLASNENKEIEE